MADILCEDHGAVRLITINRPDQMNSLDFAANAELVAAWEAFAADDRMRVAVITGAGGKSFCAGADLKTYTMNFVQRPAHEFRTQFTDGPGFGGITRGLDVGKPTLAAVNGSFSTAGTVVDQNLATAADRAEPVVRGAASGASEAVRDATTTNRTETPAGN